MSTLRLALTGAFIFVSLNLSIEAHESGKSPERPEKEVEKAVEEKKPEEKSVGEKKKGAVYAIVDGTILPVSRPPIHRGVLLFQDGKILAIGSEIPIPKDAIVYSAEDSYVSPGLVALRATVDNAKHAFGNFEDNLDPYDQDIHIALASGITTLHVMGGFRFHSIFHSMNRSVSGRPTAVIKATFRELDGMLVKEPASLSITVERSMRDIFDLREKFERASRYLRDLEVATREKKKAPKMPRGLGLYVDVLKNDLPTICTVNDLESIRTLLELRKDYPFQLVLSGTGEGWKMARELASFDVPVILKTRGPDFFFNLDAPLFEDGDMIPIRRPSTYASSGVRVALLPYRSGISLDGIAGRDLTSLAFEAAFAVRGGLAEDLAFRAITLEPARLLKIDDRVGSLEKGKDADILIWSGHPLHYRSFVKKAWVDGKLYYEKEKSPLFREIPLR